MLLFVICLQSPSFALSPSEYSNPSNWSNAEISKFLATAKVMDLSLMKIFLADQGKIADFESQVFFGNFTMARANKGES